MIRAMWAAFPLLLLGCRGNPGMDASLEIVPRRPAWLDSGPRRPGPLGGIPGPPPECPPPEEVRAPGWFPWEGEDDFEQLKERLLPSGPVHEILVRLARRQEEDGSWKADPAARARGMGDAGLTGLVLSAMASGGVTYLSPKTADGFDVGERVRKGYQYLLRNAADPPAASLPDDPVWAAMAFVHGATYSTLFDFGVTQEVNRLAAAQRDDGSWGTVERTAWAVDALRGAHHLDFPVPRSCWSRARRFLLAEGRRTSAPAARAALVWLDQAGALRNTSGPPPPSDPTDAFFHLQAGRFDPTIHGNPAALVATWLEWGRSDDLPTAAKAALFLARPRF